MKRIISSTIIMIIVLSVSSTPAFAATYWTHSGMSQAEQDAVWAAWEAEQERNAQIAKQNAAVYKATATPLQKQVDQILKKAFDTDTSQTNSATQIMELMAANPDWTVNFQVPLSQPLPPRATLVKTGYKYEEGDLRPWVWVIEDGEIMAATMNGLDTIVKRGGFHENINFVPPTGGYYINDAGGITYWGDVAEAIIAERGY